MSLIGCEKKFVNSNKNGLIDVVTCPAIVNRMIRISRSGNLALYDLCDHNR